MEPPIVRLPVPESWGSDRAAGTHPPILRPVPCRSCDPSHAALSIRPMAGGTCVGSVAETVLLFCVKAGAHPAFGWAEPIDAESGVGLQAGQTGEHLYSAAMPSGQLAMRSCSASSTRTLGMTSVPYSSMLRISWS
jgi:hypothetical protein